MATSIDNYQQSLALTEFVALQGVFPSEGGGGGGNTLAMIRTIAASSPQFLTSPAIADGELLSISQNQALFSLLGFTYGGNGTSTFALPNLKDRTSIGEGQGQGLDNYSLGQVAGSALINLQQKHLSPALGGSFQPFDNLQPSLPVTYLIRTQPTGSNLVGEIVRFAGNFVPSGHMEAAGQLLPIVGNEDLFTVIGNTFGGNGTTNFALPDLRGRNAIGASSDVPLGTKTGDLTLSNSQLPIKVGGGGMDFDNRGPGLALNYIIALEGIFPNDNSLASPPDDSHLLGEIILYAGQTVPDGWALANGQLLPINQNTALFSLLGTAFGGNGQTNFALPDLRDRTVVGASSDLPVGSVIGSNTEHVDMSDIPEVNVAGKTAGETLYGSDGNDILRGAGGNDTLIGNDGNDKLDGGDANDTLNGAAGNDSLTGGNGNDKLFGDSGNDILRGGAGADTLNGGTGNDIFQIAGSEGVGDGFIGGTGTDKIQVLGGSTATLSGFNAAASSIEHWQGNGKGLFGTSAANTLNFAALTSKTGLPFIDGGGGSDVITGSKFADTLRGNSGNDTLNGGIGNDTLLGNSGKDRLNGGDGNDRLTGGAEKDILTGGPGKDIFDFNSFRDSEGGSNRDQIKDFKHSQGDRIDLRDIDANTKKGGDQKFKFIGDDAFSGGGDKFIGDKSSGTAGELRFDNKVLQGDVNGDGKADFEIRVEANKLVASDFLL